MGAALSGQGMTRARLMPPGVVLPKAPLKYDPQHQTEALRIIEQGFAKMQPAQQRQVVTGSKASGAALTSLLTAMANLGFITNSTTA